ncbi:MAG: Tex-like N-terminal domain-containing protein, partial [Deltaproteobacteria bacterium]
MKEEHITVIAAEIGLDTHQVLAAARLLEEGATVPFMARYRKEATGSLDEVAITAIRDRLCQLAALNKRQESILKSLEERGLMTDELREKILSAQTLTTLEDIYLPYRPKRRTRGAMAKEKGLEPLAHILFAQKENTDPVREATAFVDPDREVESTDEALAGARDIIAEWINEDQEARARIRTLYA